MNKEIDEIQSAIEPLRQQIINHCVYSAINELSDLRVFMEHHIYAVWDFMSLLKSLQVNLTCTTIPWFPVGSANTRSLINEIVAGEEADVDELGNKKSHFEMYLEAMQQCGADTIRFETFIKAIQQGLSREAAYLAAGTPETAKGFVDYTFGIIEGNRVHEQCSAFTFGREDLIPNMFFSIIADLNQKFPEQLSKFKYYLERHIEVDGDHHSHLALEMTAEVCADDVGFWKDTKKVAIASLQKRIELWDGVFNEISNSK